MTKTPKTKIVYNRRKTATNDRPASVEIEVSYLNVRRWYSTGVKVIPSHWRENSHVVKRADSVELNAIINSMYASVNKVVLDCMEKGIEFQFSLLGYELEKQKQRLIVDFIAKYVDDHHLSQSTRLRYAVLRNDLLDYGRLVYLSDLNKEAIIDYDRHLHQKNGGKITDAGTFDYHKCLKALCKYARELGFLADDPYEFYHPSRGRAKSRQALTEHEISILATAKFEDAKLSIARDLFLFQTYTGLAYADMMNIDYRSRVRVYNNKKVITGQRVKSREDFYIVLVTPAIAILDKYDWKLPSYTNQAYNRNLKEVCKSVGIETSVTSHVGRHTFACIAINRGINIEVIAKILGHTNIRTTQIYAKIANRFVDDGFSVLENVFA